MNRKLITVSVAAAVMAFGATAASAATTVIGSTGQSNQQGVNSSQSGENGSSGGNTYILGNSSPTTTQVSVNTLVNVQDIGAGTTTTLIAPGNDCFCQSSQQGVNSSQVAVNGDGGGTLTAILGNSTPSLTQASINTGVNVELIGGGFGPGSTTTLIGGSAQTNDQAFNSAQSGENTSGATGTLVVGGNSGAALTQASLNTLINVTLLGS